LIYGICVGVDEGHRPPLFTMLLYVLVQKTKKRVNLMKKIEYLLDRENL